MSIRAINCTQCGATIQDVSIHSTVIECEYCGARIMLDKSKPITKEVHYIKPPSFPPPAPNSSPVKTLTAVGAAIVISIVVVWMLASGSRREETEPVRAYSVPSPSLVPWNGAALVPDKPLPVVNYQPRVSWDGPNDLEHFEEPQVDISSVSHLTSEEIKKTVFKNRLVKLRVVINTEGEINDVETISGHPILVEAATASAKRSIFRTRSKATTRILTYTFRVLED